MLLTILLMLSEHKEKVLMNELNSLMLLSFLFISLISLSSFLSFCVRLYIYNPLFCVVVPVTGGC